MAELIFDEASRPFNPIPGPRGLIGPAGAAGAAGASGPSAYSNTTAAFTQPAVNSNVVVPVANSAFLAVGEPVFVATGGTYSVVTINSAISITLKLLNIPAGFVATASPVASGSLVTPGGYAFVDNSQYTALALRVTALEAGVQQPPSFRQPGPPPLTTYIDGTVWFDSDDGMKMYTWNATTHTWVAVDFSFDDHSLGVGLVAVQILGVLPVAGMHQGDVVFLTTDNKLYRYTGTAWTTVINGSDIYGTIDGGQLAANSIVAGKISAGAITASAIGTNLIITTAANIQAATITDAHIQSLAVSKITAGAIAGQVIQLSGAGGILQSTTYVAGSAGFRLDGLGNAEFNSVTVRGTLLAGKVGNDSTIFNPATPANAMASSTWQNWQDGTSHNTLGGGTDFWLGTFYGWAHGSGTPGTRFGKSTTGFDCIANGGCTPTGAGAYVDYNIIYRINGGATQLVNPFVFRALIGNGTVMVAGGVQITGLGGTDQIDFGFRAGSNYAASTCNVVNLTVRCFNI